MHVVSPGMARNPTPTPGALLLKAFTSKKRDRQAIGVSMISSPTTRSPSLGQAAQKPFDCQCGVL